MKEKLTDRLINSLAPTDKRYEVRDTVVPGFLVRVGVTGLKSYYLVYTGEDGKRSKYKIGLCDAVSLADAREEARRRAGEVAAGKNLNQVKKEARQKSIAEKSQKLGTFIDDIYRPWREAERKRADEDLDRLKLHFGGWYSKPMTEITERKVLEFRQKRLGKGISEKTVNRDIAALMAVLSHAVRVGVLKESPLKKFKQLKVDMRTKVRFLSKEEDARLMELLEGREAKAREGRSSYNRFLKDRKKPLKPEIREDQFSDHVYPLILIAIHTGCRPEELLELDWKNVDLGHKTLTVVGAGAKSGQTRHIPLSNKAVEAFERWQRSPGSKKKGLVFPGKTGKPMERLPRAITRVIENAQIEDFRPYDFRHTFASRLALAGVDLNTIRELLGHEDISTTLIYAHLTHDHRKEAVARVFG
ncbi:site-specific integrase [Marinobacter qingdaonensis]|uniref:Site-specific integrase n=1 Tax=Marinobacter qingdaonensis TaxID=3108486 RepID=A0ABU5NUQ2_9GAMM|nr:site-specific integrase [Marinobacter sp. ASW11-75]MEA1079548.1 site-specific integrase [Marinobacter sp. ASW11-75]